MPSSVDRKGQSLISFGVISDVQYANADDAWNFEYTRMRFYRTALEHLNEAILIWKNVSVDFAIQLGDLIDGKTAISNDCNRALTLTLDTCDLLGNPVYHVLGNHELYCFDRDQIAKSQLNTRKLFDSTLSDKLYYSFCPCDKFRIVVLDTFDVSMLGVAKHSEDYKIAEALVRSKNTNTDLNSCDDLPIGFHHYAMFNGAISERQLQWLEHTLEKAVQHNEHVLIIGHVPIYEPATDSYCKVWNCDDVLCILHKYGGNVVAYLAGHDHKGGYAIDNAGIHHITFDGVVEVAAMHNSFAVIHVYEDRLELEGYGLMKSRIMPFR